MAVNEHSEIAPILFFVFGQPPGICPPATSIKSERFLCSPMFRSSGSSTLSDSVIDVFTFIPTYIARF